MKHVIKYAALLTVGGLTYIIIELMARGHTHWTMYILGGICLILIGLTDEIIPWDMPFLLQMLIGAGIVTIAELVTGLIVNIGLGWAVWDYSALPFNFMGQICLQYSVYWYFLSALAIILDDWTRYGVDLFLQWISYGKYKATEQRPHYRLI